VTSTNYAPVTVAKFTKKYLHSNINYTFRKLLVTGIVLLFHVVSGLTLILEIIKMIS
jgi:hypothetical protein